MDSRRQQFQICNIIIIDIICRYYWKIHNIFTFYLKLLFNELKIVEAILKKSKEIAFQALLLDPTISNASKAEGIFEEMLEINKNYINLE